MTAKDVSGFLTIVIEVAMIIVNIFPIYVGCKYKRQSERSAVDELIISLSCFTVIMVLLTAPLGLVYYFRSSFGNAHAFCDMFQSSTTCFQFFSLFIISLLCVNRFQEGSYATKGHTYIRAWSTRTTVLLISLALFISIFIAILPEFGMAPLADEPSNFTCHLWISNKATSIMQGIYFVVYLVFGYTDSVIVALAVVGIFLEIKKVKRLMYNGVMAGERDTVFANDSCRRSYIDSSRLAYRMAAVFYLTWVPSLVLITLKKLDLQISETAVSFALIGTTLTGLLNPLLYGLTDRTYRAGYKKLTECMKNTCRCTRKTVTTAHSVSMEYTMTGSNGSETCDGHNEIPPITVPASSQVCSTGVENIAYDDHYTQPEVSNPEEEMLICPKNSSLNESMDFCAADADSQSLPRSDRSDEFFVHEAELCSSLRKVYLTDSSVFSTESEGNTTDDSLESGFEGLLAESNM
ncbi:hypothetical protein CHS0354_015705 [Potamilus streckersoni]|uniref:G-protein coupled receptors family 1 profile domain-containing protein n=1 Tax=Potamilus streckersoni TaxID=2493646 RepID=A0AAE0TJ38_9BIVA|nr:hypothetical protein CHS0354_015705 [Potamilus streckersoni]